MLRILLADDCPNVRQSVRALLEREGFDIVAEAGDGYEAVAAAEAARPDVAVVDLAMPYLDGVGAARRMASLGLCIPVVLLSCHLQEHQIVGALRLGVTAYVLKAEAAEHLGPAIRQVADGHLFLSPAARRVVAHHVEEHEGELSMRGA